MDITTIFEYTERAARVIRAAQAAESRLSVPDNFLLLMPAVGDEIEFPSITGRAVFTISKRRFRVTGGLDDAPTITLLLDAPEHAAGPIDSVA
jgi:hypothetical protein